MRQITFDPSIPMALWAPLAAAAAALMLWYAASSRGRLPRRRWPAVVALMAVAVMVPLVVLLNPTWLERIPPPAGKPLLTILVDRSASMATSDADGGRTRYAFAARFASEAAAQLAQHYEVRVRCFAEGSSLLTPGELSRRKPDGATTDLAGAVEDALDDVRPQGQAVLLVSDGIHNAGGGMERVRRSVAKAKALAAPVYVKTVGADAAVRDLSVGLDRPRELAFVGQRVPVTINLKQRGSLAGQTTLAVTLNGQVVDSRRVELVPGGESEQTVDLMQNDCGLYRYEIRADPLPEEVTAVNNRATLLLRVVAEPVRVLLLEGKPYWDTKFLIRTLSQDPSIELVSVVRMADGRLLERRIARLPGEADSGKGGQQEEEKPQPTVQPDRAFRFDQWSIRKDAGQLLSDPQTLASCQIVMLGRDAEVFLTDEALASLEKWLKQRECSLVCFRGAPSSQISQRLGRLLPVRWTPSRETRFRVRMTQSGRNLRWLPQVDEAGLAGLPSLAAMARPETRALAETLAESVSGGQSPADPVITHLRVGMGRVVVVEGAGMWRWAFLPPQYEQQNQAYRLLWRSLIRWLIADIELLPSQRLALKLDKVTFSTAEAAAANLLVRQEHLGEPIPDVELTGSGLAEPRVVAPVPSGSYPGQFRVVFGRLPEGQYRARVAGAGDDEVAAVTAFDVRRGNLEELLEVEAKPELMKLIAQQSDGFVLAGADPGVLVGHFQQHLSRIRPERTTQTTLWDRWWVLLGSFALWGAAWGLRRRSGLV